MASKFQPKVRSTTIPAAAMASSRSGGVTMPSSVRQVKCSSPSTPAATACQAPRTEWVWATTDSPASWPSETISARSSGENCTPSWSEPGVSIPPEAITLMTSTPRSTCSAIAARIASGPSATPPR